MPPHGCVSDPRDSKRIATLADRAQDPALRRDLHAIRERLLNEEQALLSTKR